MPPIGDRQVNGKPLRIAIDLRKSAPFYPLDLQKTENKDRLVGWVGSMSVREASRPLTFLLADSGKPRDPSELRASHDAGRRTGLEAGSRGGRAGAAERRLM